MKGNVRGEIQLSMQRNLAAEIMKQFAHRTGIERGKSRRYLWTDAFAVCNFLELGRQTGDSRYEDLARLLIDQVHHVLGHHRDDDNRHGWLSGLNDNEGENHPTKGGLRIGKTLPERQPGEPFDERLEWDRDGQYYHYLTKWMLALNRIARQTSTPLFNHWAIELAQAAHAGFVYRTPDKGKPRMYWKMSIDLTRPLVPAMGHHDPLDGLLTFHDLQAESIAEKGQSQSGNLTTEIAELANMCKGVDWVTDDPLGIGGLLSDALRVVMLQVKGKKMQFDGLLVELLAAGAKGLSFYTLGNTLNQPAGYRLAFRELGLTIGLHAAERINDIFSKKTDIPAKQEGAVKSLHEILKHLPLCSQIETFWLNAENQRAETWKEHLDINTVMLATSLIPNGYFGIADNT